MSRLDLKLVELKLAPSRSKAQRMIENGEVEIAVAGEWLTANSASREAGAFEIRVKDGAQTLKYVSRGGLKLEGALRELALDVKGFNCLDLGLSTGGFTDCLLKSGARSVVGYDVGHGQLDPRLASETRLESHEGVNVRELNLQGRAFDLCVMDLSFISLRLVLPVLGRELVKGTRLLALVKPQFEVGAENLNKNGIVVEPKLYGTVQAEILRTLENCGFSELKYFASEVKGQDGNQEFFAYARRDDREFNSQRM